MSLRPPGTTLAVLAAGLLSLPAAAAGPPALTYLYPAGARRGTTVEVMAGGPFERWPARVWASGTGVEARAAKEKGRLTVTVAADAVPGTYWVRLFDGSGASPLRPFLVGTLPEVVARGPKDPARPRPVAVPAVVNGRLGKPGEVDAFAVELRRGQTLVAALEANRTLKSPMDGVLQVLSADGFVLDQNNDAHGLDPQVVFRAPGDGTYVVRVFAFPATPDSTIGLAGADTYVYRLTLTAGGFAEHALPLAVPRAAPGTVALVGWNIPPSAGRVPVLAAADGATGTAFHPLVANPVRVRLEPHPCWDAGDGKARVPGSLAPPFTVTGCLGKAGEVGRFAFEARKGQPLLLQLEAGAVGSPLTPVLAVLGAGGKPLARAEPPALNGDVSLPFAPPRDGVFRAEVRDLHGDGGRLFVYRLRVVRPEPDFDLGLAGDRLHVVAGKPLDVPVAVQRHNGFAGDVELSVTGLPAGVTATAVGGGSGGSLLRFTAGKAGFSGPVRVVGRARAQPDLVRVARGAVPGFDEKTPDLWLTVSDTEAPPARPARKR